MTFFAGCVFLAQLKTFFIGWRQNLSLHTRFFHSSGKSQGVVSKIWNLKRVFSEFFYRQIFRVNCIFY